MKNRKKLSFFIAVVIVMLMLFELYLSNRLTAEGRYLEKLQDETAGLEEENNFLKNSIANGGGLIKLNEIAQEKGFVKNPPVINLTTRVPVALSK